MNHVKSNLLISPDSEAREVKRINSPFQRFFELGKGERFRPSHSRVEDESLVPVYPGEDKEALLDVYCHRRERRPV